MLWEKLKKRKKKGANTRKKTKETLKGVEKSERAGVERTGERYGRCGGGGMWERAEGSGETWATKREKGIEEKIEILQGE